MLRKLILLFILTIGMIFPCVRAEGVTQVKFNSKEAFLELEEVVLKKMKFEKERGIESSTYKDLISLFKKYQKDENLTLSGDDSAKFIEACVNNILPWLREHSNGQASMKEAENKCLQFIAQALNNPTTSNSFRRSRAFWLDTAHYNVGSFTKIITPALKNKLVTLKTIKLFCKLELNNKQKQKTLELLKTSEKFQQPEASYLAVCARLGDKKSETKLLQAFSSSLSEFDDYKNLEKFDALRVLCEELAYTGTDKCAILLVKSLSSLAQHISYRGNESIKKSILLSLLKFYPKEFEKIFKIPLSDWIFTHGSLTIANPQIKQIPKCTDQESLKKFHSFCTSKFGKLEWEVDDLWFSFNFAIPIFPKEVDVTIPMPKPVLVSKKRKTSIY